MSFRYFSRPRPKIMDLASWTLDLAVDFLWLSQRFALQPSSLSRSNLSTRNTRSFVRQHVSSRSRTSNHGPNGSRTTNIVTTMSRCRGRRSTSASGFARPMAMSDLVDVLSVSRASCATTSMTLNGCPIRLRASHARSSGERDVPPSVWPLLARWADKLSGMRFMIQPRRSTWNTRSCCPRHHIKSRWLRVVCLFHVKQCHPTVFLRQMAQEDVADVPRGTSTNNTSKSEGSDTTITRPGQRAEMRLTLS
jgi:hypothetical protein